MELDPGELFPVSYGQVAGATDVKLKTEEGGNAEECDNTLHISFRRLRGMLCINYSSLL